MEGIFEEVNFIPSDYYSMGWKFGPPRGIMFHHDTEGVYGPGESVHLEIWPDGSVNQFVSLSNRSWHALEASDYYFSINHIITDEAKPDFTYEQLQQSSKLSAEIIKFTKEKWGMKIPIIRAPGPGFSPGFKEHRDGVGSAWNPLMHRDGLSGIWSWQNYLDNVKLEIEEDDMAIFQDKEDFRKESLKALVGFDAEGNPNLDSGQVYEALTFLLGINLRLRGGDRPSKADSLQKGWDFAEKVNSIDPESWATEFPNGRLSGTITFQN